MTFSSDSQSLVLCLIGSLFRSSSVNAVRSVFVTYSDLSCSVKRFHSCAYDEMRLSDDVEDSKIMPNKMPKCPDIGPRRLTNDELVV